MIINLFEPFYYTAKEEATCVFLTNNFTVSRAIMTEVQLHAIIYSASPENTRQRCDSTIHLVPQQNVRYDRSVVDDTRYEQKTF